MTKSDRQEKKVRKALYAGAKAISRHVWEEAMRLTEQATQQQRRTA
jgi:hypothetical protein